MEKYATGIDGFDEISDGGLPRSRISLIAGAAGCGKTLFMLTTVARGFAMRGEPAVFFSFEERAQDVVENATSIGLDLGPLIEAGSLHVEHIKRPTEVVAEAGQYTLEGLLMRIELALKRTGARTIAIDTIETLFGMFENERTVRGELVRLFTWLKDRGVSTLISAEQGDGQLTRHGLEEYISDCVVLLDQRVIGDVATRRVRVVKYRGAQHGNNEYPFLIDAQGITIMPLSSARLDHKVIERDLPTGLARLDEALCGGYRQGTTTLISGTAGSGKTILAATFAAEVCRRGEKIAIFNFEESPDEFMFNVKSAGIDLPDYSKTDNLLVQSARPTLLGLEQHLVEIYRTVEQFKPEAVIMDPLSSLEAAGSSTEVYRTIVRLIDHLKREQITTILTAEETEGRSVDSGLGISSIIDTWLYAEWDHTPDGFQRWLSVIKKRGSGHLRGYLRFEIGPNGIEFESKSHGG